VHEYAAARGPRDCTRELEATETGVPRTMQADRVRRSSTRLETVVGHAHRCELALEPDDERVDALVRGDEVRAQADDHDVQALGARVRERTGELRGGSRPGEPRRGTPRPHRPAPRRTG